MLFTTRAEGDISSVLHEKIQLRTNKFIKRTATEMEIQNKLLQTYSCFTRIKSEIVNYVIPSKHELYLPNI